MTTTIAGYQVNEQIYESDNSLVYRGHRETDNQPAILKMLKQAYPSPEKIAWFRREYEIIRQMNSSTLPPVPGQIPSQQTVTGVVIAHSLETDQQRWVMILEDFGGESLVRLGLAGKMALAEFLPLAIQITDILGQVHQRHIMHKDINLSNIVLNSTTGQVKLIDFGISTALSRENPTLRNPNVLEGTLAYISPEQTGRMNRAIDYRTDFYSLGVTFYELLVGQLPFPTTDALALVHAHIAKQPLPPHVHKSAIPQSLSEIVLKLMAKNAEDRYQSAYGLKEDLEECLRQWQATGRIISFPTSQHDISDRFQIPQKLYGREREIEMLLATFEQIAGTNGSGEAALDFDNVGATQTNLDESVEILRPGDLSKEPVEGTRKSKIEMMLVSGYPGIGKSALIQEIYKPITRQRGYFIAGKFDQFQKNIPYVAVVQALRALMRQLLTESETQIAAWREKLSRVLGLNGQVIVEVIPEVELIIGPQPAAPELPPTEAQNRFNLVFQNFLRVFTQPEHPLVLFLDDLQWADVASLQLLKLLMTTPDNQYLFIVGAYRDNEVSAAHPLMLTLDEIRQAGGSVRQIALGPLGLPHVNQLVCDTLNCSSEQARPLAELVLTKTNGNPFFMNEFLKSLYTESLLGFDFPHSRWRWDLEQIQKRGITDNVVELMAGKVQKLPVKAQQALKLAACIGNQFDLQTLAIVYEKSPRETAVDLWEAMTEGLILPLGDAYKLMDLEVQGLADEVTVEYKFTHDRIQQAVYSLIPAEDKQAVHWQVGQLLLRNTTPEEREQKIFDIVNQLNLGLERIDNQTARSELIELNLLAGQKAKASAAYASAFNYLQIGLDLLGSDPDTWQSQVAYDLALKLHIEAAEAAYLSGDFEQMERLTEIVLNQAKTLMDKVKVYQVKIEAYIAQNKPREAVQITVEVLKLMGIEFPKKPGQIHNVMGVSGIKFALTGKRIEDLVNLPEMKDPDKLAAMRILSSALAAAYVGFPELLSLFTFRMVNLSLKYGNTPLSIQAYATYGLILCGGVGDIESGYKFGQLALGLVERFNAHELKPRTFFIVNGFINHWKEHLRESLKPLLEGYQIGLEIGDFEFAAYNAFDYGFHAYCLGQELTGLEKDMAKYSQAIIQINRRQSLYLNELYRQAVLNLIGRAEHRVQLSGESYDEETMRPLHFEVNDWNAVCQLYFNKLILCYLFEEYSQAVENAALAEPYLAALIGTPVSPIFYFYDSLARLGVWPDTPKSEQKQLLKKIAANQKKIKKWAKHAPMNYLHKFHLVEAESDRLLGRNKTAREHYDKAIDLARTHEYLNEEALANELAARFYLANGQTRLAHHYLRDAHYAYLRWGALAKVKDLETRYPQFLAQAEARSRELPTVTTPTTDTGETVSTLLDLASVLKASQAISGEIVLDRLLEKLMKIVIENAGAQQGFLILEEEGRWVIEAEAEVKAEAKIKALASIPVETSDKLSAAIINYVARTKEYVVLNDAGHEGMFTKDPYISHNQPKSILCAPLINQGKLTGILYLENNLTIGAFTPDRLEVLNILSAQAAISIENARLYTYQVQMTNAASRFVPYEFLQFLKKESIVKLNLGDQAQQNMTIMVSDIRSFTTLSEAMTPQENFDFVNIYLGRVSPIIRQHQGFIAKYMGDGIMAVFPGRVEDAIDAAIAQLRELARYNADRQQQDEMPIQIGLGIHGGPVMLGTVGEVERMQLDLLSDAVNVTARLEGLTKLYGAPLVISTQVLKQLAESSQYQIRFLGKTQVKGRHEMLSVFEVFDGDPPETIALKVETKADFEKGLSHYYDWDFDQAKTYFMQVLQRYPADKATQFYLERMADFAQPKTLAEEVSAETLTKQ